MSERHLIAYVLIAAMLVAAGYGMYRWRRAINRRRYPSRFRDR